MIVRTATSFLMLLTILTCGCGGKEKNSKESSGSGSDNAAKAVSTRYMTSDTFAAVILHPKELLSVLPEDALNEIKSQVGFDPASIQKIEVYFGTSFLSNNVPTVLLHFFSNPVDLLSGVPAEQINEIEISYGNSSKKRVKKAFEVAGPGLPVFGSDGKPGKLVFVPDGKQLLLGSSEDMANVLAAEELEGPFADVYATVDTSKQFSALVVIEPLLTVYGSGLSQAEQGVPGMTQLAQSVNALILSGKVAEKQRIELQINMKSQESAQNAEKMLRGLIDQGKSMWKAVRPSILANAPESKAEEVGVLADNLLNSLTLLLDGQNLFLAINIPSGTQALLEDAINEAKLTANAVERSNDFREVAIAFHSHAAVHKGLPVLEKQGLDSAGNPLLSWRVHLLPELGQEELYSQFKLDEPWDSEHNIKLLSKAPKIFGSNNDPTKTTIRRFQSKEGNLVGGDNGLKFDDMRDGSRNTILLVEVGEENAQPWTKPGGIPFDAAKPLPKLGRNGDDYVTVAFADASVWRMRKSKIDDEVKSLLKKLIQHRDGKGGSQAELREKTR